MIAWAAMTRHPVICGLLLAVAACATRVLDAEGDTSEDAGDGDGDSGDGDGDSGDGDGDAALPMNCGWFAEGSPPGYYCDAMGEDPDGVVPIACPSGLVENDPCGSITGAGCCDANGDNWYCADDGMGQYLFLDVCS
jgi:hypothetical protein